MLSWVLCIHFLCFLVLQLYVKHHLSCATYTQNIVWKGSSAIFIALVSLSPLCIIEQSVYDGAFNFSKPAMRGRQLLLTLAYIAVMHTNPISWPFSNMNSVPCGYNLQSDITTRLHFSIHEIMILRAVGEWKGSKSTVVTNLSLHQTNRRALDLQNNQQPAKRFEQTPAGCHSEEQMPFLKK